MKRDEYAYSDKIPGNARNHKFTQKFDISGDGYLGITQTDDGSVTDRVLLNPAQVKALLAFLKQHAGKRFGLAARQKGER